MTLEKPDIKIKAIKKVPILVEKDLQRFTENNLEEIFGYEFIATEFKIGDFRIDSLGFDKKNNSFVIIEYKKELNEGILTQCKVYYKLFLENKDLVIDTYNSKFNTDLKEEDFDFDNTNILAIAPAFTRFQLELSKDDNCGFELWKVSLYNNKTIKYERLNKEKVTNTYQIYSSTNSFISEEKSKYSERHLLKNKSYHTKSIYKLFRDSILNNYNNIEGIIYKTQIVFNLKDKRLLTCSILKNGVSIRINMKKGSLNDYENKTIDVSKYVGELGDYEYKILDKSEIDYFMDLFEETYRLHNNENN